MLVKNFFFVLVMFQCIFVYHVLSRKHEFYGRSWTHLFDAKCVMFLLKEKYWQNDSVYIYVRTVLFIFIKLERKYKPHCKHLKSNIVEHVVRNRLLLIKFFNISSSFVIIVMGRVRMKIFPLVTILRSFF